MRRADRLFDIVQLLRGGRLRTAQELADRLEVSVRTVYRDIDALVASGVPIEGERGVGYILRDGMLLPPLAFSETELQAMALGAQLVRAWADEDLARAAEEVLAKVDAVVAGDRKDELWRQELQAFGSRVSPETRHRLGLLRRAIRHRQKVKLGYRSGSDAVTERTVRPLGLEAWGHAWTMTGWCELRNDFRVFRVDRMAALDLLDEKFRPEAGKTLRDYMSKMAESGCCRPMNI